MKMHFPKKRSEKVKGERYTFKCGRVYNSFSFNAAVALQPVNHKGKHVLAFVDKWKGTYRTCETISYSDALRLMGFLAAYINAMKPIPITSLTASTNAHCNGINRDQNKILAECFNIQLPEEAEE